SLPVYYYMLMTLHNNNYTSGDIKNDLRKIFEKAADNKLLRLDVLMAMRQVLSEKFGHVAAGRERALARDYPVRSGEHRRPIPSIVDGPDQSDLDRHERFRQVYEQLNRKFLERELTVQINTRHLSR